jgi:Ca-activated chloride channel family protein
MTTRTSMSTRRALLASLLSALFLLGTVTLHGLAQDQQPSQLPGQEPSGPTAPAGEATVVPKKTLPATPPPEKQPDKINPNEIYTLRTTTNLVNVDVLVTDSNGNPIPSLSKKNFRILDDGVPQTITNFSTAEAPLTVCMLIEFSNKWWGFLYTALEDAYEFLNFMQPKDWVAVVYFDMKPHILTDFTQDRFAVKAALDTLRIPGFSETNLYDALAFTIDRMKDIQGRKAIIAICTGIDTFSKITYPQMLKIAKSSDTPIYPISILEWLDVRTMGSMTEVEARSQLGYIAQYSGGEAFFPRFQGELPAIYQQIAGQLRTQYSLGYVPSNNQHDGRYHKLKIELVDDQGQPLRIVNQKGKLVKYRVQARDGYYAPRG